MSDGFAKVAERLLDNGFTPTQGKACDPDKTDNCTEIK